MKKNTATKTRLLDVAIDLIWQSSYSNVGVNEICKEAGVTKGSFYHYFESKADLFYEASMNHWKTIEINLNEIFSNKHKPIKQLENLLSYILEKQIKHAESTKNAVSGCPIFTSGGQAGAGEEKVRQTAEEISKNAVRYNIELVEELIKDGYAKDNIEPTFVGRMLYQYIQGLLLYSRVYRDIDIVKQDLRAGVYRILGIKDNYIK